MVIPLADKMIEKKRDRTPSLKKCAKLLMFSTIKQIANSPSITRGSENRPNGTERKEVHSHSLTSASSSDGDSPLSSIHRDDGVAARPEPDLNLIFDMSRCSITEKIQRWNQASEVQPERPELGPSEIDLFFGPLSLRHPLREEYDEAGAAPGIDQRQTEPEWPETDIETMESDRKFIREFVDLIFNDYSAITEMMKADFGRLVQHAHGREAFAIALNERRAQEKVVDEETLLRLEVQMAIALCESYKEGDYSAARQLMNMCSTFTSKDPFTDEPINLYDGTLRALPMWKDRRFWRGMFFNAMDACTVDKRQELRENPSLINDTEFQASLRNSAYGLIGTFAHSFFHFGMPLTESLEMVSSLAVVNDLNQGQAMDVENYLRAFYDRAA